MTTPEDILNRPCRHCDEGIDTAECTCMEDVAEYREFVAELAKSRKLLEETVYLLWNVPDIEGSTWTHEAIKLRTKVLGFLLDTPVESDAPTGRNQ